MQAEIPDELIDLLERLSEGSLDESGREQLVAMLREQPQLRTIVQEHFLVSRALSQLEQTDSNFAGKTAAHVAKIAAESEFGFAKKVTGKIVRQRITKVFAAAAVIALVAVPASLTLRKPGVEVATLVRMDPEHGVVSSRTVRTGEKLDETSGLIRLDFKNGAVMAVEAPAKFTIVSDMEIALKSGKLNGWCPKTAHGFKVTTASADLTDLGTSFGVTATPDGKSEFMVLEGAVEVQKGDEKMRLTRGDAVKASTREKLSSAEFDPSDFKNTWPLAQGIFATKGAVVPANPDTPEKVALMESDDHVLVIPERRAVPFIRPLRVNIVDVGTLPDTLPDKVYFIKPVPGKHLSSFLIRYDPVGTFPDDYFKKFEGEVTFERPVMAIVTGKATLEGTDEAFAMGKWESKYRGIELDQINNPPDSVALSPDRRTVKVVFYAGASTDEIRVILEDQQKDL
jgi:hypothetical protein